MSMQPQPETIYERVDSQIEKLVVGGGVRISTDDFHFRRLVAECDRVLKSSVAEGSFLRSRLYAAAGDVDQALYWADNAAKNGRPSLGLIAKFGALLLNGKMRSAYELRWAAFGERGQVPVHSMLRLAFGVGWFWTVQEIKRVCVEQQIVFTGVDALGLASEAIRVLESHGVGEESMVELFSAAHSVMQEERLIWSGEVPLVSFHETEHPSRYVLIRYPLQVTAKRAAELSWRLAERIGERGLDQPGIIISFSPLSASEPVVEELTAA